MNAKNSFGKSSLRFMCILSFELHCISVYSLSDFSFKHTFQYKIPFIFSSFVPFQSNSMYNSECYGQK